MSAGGRQGKTLTTLIPGAGGQLLFILLNNKINLVGLTKMIILQLPQSHPGAGRAKFFILLNNKINLVGLTKTINPLPKDDHSSHPQNLTNLQTPGVFLSDGEWVWKCLPEGLEEKTGLTESGG